MKHTLRTIALLAGIGLPLAGSAQIIVWQQNFDSLTLGVYGAHTADFANDATNPALVQNNIVTAGSGQAMAVTFNAVSGTTLNFQTATLATAPSGATSANLSDYVLSFDMAIEGVDIATGYGGLQISVQGNDGGIFGQGAISPFVVPAAGTAGAGYKHYSYNLGTFSAGGGGALTPATDSSLAFGIGVVAYGNAMTASPETLLVDNVQIAQVVPEPSSIALVGAGLAMGTALIRRRRA